MSKKRRNRLGFTLTEMMAAIAILIVTFSIGGVSATSIKKGLNQTKADAVAREIYVMAQENLTKLRTSGNDDCLDENNVVEDLYTPEPNGGNVSNLRYLYKTPGNEDDSSSNGIDLLIDQSLLEIDEENSSYVIEYDPVTGLITSVFFGENEDFNDYYYANDDYNPNYLRTKNNRLKFRDSREDPYYVGYYGDGDTDNTSSVDSDTVLHPEITISNKEELVATIKVKVPTALRNSTYDVTLTYTGRESGATLEQTYTTSLTNDVESFEVSYVLDSLDTINGKDFNTLFNSASSAVGVKTSANKNFIVGEDISLKVIAYVHGRTDTANSPVTKKFNSQFASIERYDTSTKKRIAYIEYTRHLQNLNNCENNNNYSVVKAIQTRDIDAYLPAGISFVTIRNNSLTTYEGNAHYIKNLEITGKVEVNQTTKDTVSGLFAEFGKIGEGSSINNVKLINTKVVNTGATHVGSLIGITYGNVEINNTGIYLENVATNNAPSDYVSGVNAGGMVGYVSIVKDENENPKGGITINNSFASTVVYGKLLAGGFIGAAEDGASVSFIKSYTDCYLSGAGTVGGLAGYADNCIIDYCYTAGFVIGHKNGSITEYPLIAASFVNNKIQRNGDHLLSAYTIMDLGKAAWKIANVPTDLNKGLLQEGDKLIYLKSEKYDEWIKEVGVNIDENGVDSNAVLAADLKSENKLDTVLGVGSTENIFVLDNTKKTHPYNFNGLSLSVYNYPTISSIEHYGDWSEDLSSELGFFYWEYEEGSTNSNDNGYHYYVIRADESIDSNLCIDRDDDGDITKYGYGYFMRADLWNANAVTWDDHTSVSWISKNAEASNEMRRVMLGNGGYIVNAYQTLNPKDKVYKDDKQVDVLLDIIGYAFDEYFGIANKRNEVFSSAGKNYLYLVGNHTTSTVTFNPKGTNKEYEFTFNPFFAADIEVGDYWDYYFKDGLIASVSNPRSRQIRSIEQLQFLNWNYLSMSCHTLSNEVYHAYFPFLEKSQIAGQTLNYSTVTYNQTHELDAAGMTDYTPIAALEFTGASSAVFTMYNWFNSTYNGHSYQIKNLNIESTAQTVGLFGTTNGARLENIIMTSDSDNNYIKRTSSEGISGVFGDYYIGGIVGLASDDNLGFIVDNDVIRNCAIGGYDIIDQTSQFTSINGASAVGGIVGASDVTVENCSAVVDIQMDSTAWTGTVYVGGVAGSANNGTDIDVSVEDCYSGGSITFTEQCKKPSLLRATNSYYVGGIIGGNYGVEVTNLNVIGKLINHSTIIRNCYTYMSLPEKNLYDRIQAIGIIAGHSSSAIPSLIYDCYYDKSYVSGRKITNNLNFIEVDSISDYVKVLSGNISALTSQQMASSSYKKHNAMYVYPCGTGSTGNYPFDAKVKYDGNNDIRVHVGFYPSDIQPAARTVVTLDKGISGSYGDEHYKIRSKTSLGYTNDIDNTITTGTKYDSIRVVNKTYGGGPRSYVFKIDGYASFLGYSYNGELVVDEDGYFIKDSSLFTNEEWSCEQDAITLVATFEVYDYTVTLDLNGGKLEEGISNPIHYNIESPSFDVPEPSKDGYKFTGWSGTRKYNNGVYTETLARYNNTQSISISKGTYGNFELKANWTLQDYTITYDLAGGSLPSGKTNAATYNAESNTFTLNNPEKEGYTFLGWTGSNGDTPEANVTITKGSSGDRNYTANWSKNTYSIEYNLNGGTVDGTNPVEYDAETATFTLINPARTGYTFAGWTGTDLSETTKTVSIATGSAGNRTYTANWQAIDYAITYTLNGGTVSPENKATYNIETDTFTLTNPTKAGYTFTGWTGSNGSTAQTTVTIAKGSIGNKSYKANWSKDTYTITYNLNGGTVSKTNKTSYQVDTNSFTLTNPTRTGYTFTGWTGTDLSETTKTVTIKKGSTGNRTYTANWQAIDYTITYTLNGGTVSPENKATYNIETDAFTLTNPTRTGYTFAGWTGTDLSETTKTVTIAKGSIGNRTYTANWQAVDYDITYTLNGGTVSPENKATYNIETNTFTLTNPTRDGYVFLGWTGSNGTTAQTTVTIAKGSTGDKSYTANWSKIYSISYNLDSGTVATANPETYTKETASFTLNNPTRKGYVFLGWTGSNGTTAQTTVTIAKGSTGDKSYTANWSKIYSISYNLDGGTVATANKTTYTKETESFTLNNPTRDGYEFLGWTGTELSSASKSVTIAKGSTGDKSYTANWSKIYSISYNLDGGTVATANKTTYTKETASFTLNNPTRDGYVFLGWTGSNGSTAQTSITIAKGSEGNKTYTANWKAYEFVLNSKYYSNTKTIQLNTDTCNKLSSKYKFENNVANIDGVSLKGKDNYVLDGWYLKDKTTKVFDSDGNLVSGAQQYFDKSGTTNLYAVWAMNIENAYVKASNLENGRTYLLVSKLSNQYKALAFNHASYKENNTYALKVISLNNTPTTYSNLNYVDSLGNTINGTNVILIKNTDSLCNFKYVVSGNKKNLTIKVNNNNYYLTFDEHWGTEYIEFSTNGGADDIYYENGWIRTSGYHGIARRVLTLNNDMCITKLDSKKSTDKIDLYEKIEDIKLIDNEN